MQSWSRVRLHPRHVAPNGLQMLIPAKTDIGVSDVPCSAPRDRAAYQAPLGFFPPSCPWAGDKMQELFGPAQHVLLNSSFTGGHF